MTEWDYFLTGLGGGILGGFATLAFTYHHWRRLADEYMDARHHLKDTVKIMDIADDVQELKDKMAIVETKL